MIGDWLGRGERLARDRQQQKISEIAAELRAILGSSSVEVEEARVLVRGRGIIKRWLVDPSLRFLGGGLK
jgi:hypothetical protein